METETAVSSTGAGLDSQSGSARARWRLPHWLLEGLFIVLSVVLGFAVAQFGAYRTDRELRARVLAGFETEIAQNMAKLEPFVPVHRRWVAALGKADL